MKQKKNNQKIVNWHRPLRRGEFHSGYVRGLVQARLEPIREFEEEELHQDRCIRCDDVLREWDDLSNSRCNFCERKDASEEYDIYESVEDLSETFVNRITLLKEPTARNILGRMVFLNRIPLPMELVDEAREALAAGGVLGGKKVCERELAAKYQSALASEKSGGTSCTVDPRELVFLRQVLGLPQREGLNAEESDGTGEFLVRLLALFADYRSRGVAGLQLNGADSHERVLRLARHFFSHYPVPQWLDTAWRQAIAEGDDIGQRLKWACWFVCMGGGGSVRKMTKAMGYAVSSTTLRYLHEAPADLAPEVTCMWAEAMAITRKRRVADWMVKHQGYHINITSPPESQSEDSFRRFWLQTVKWFARYEKELTDEQADELLEWGWFRFDHAAREDEAPFSWKGRKPGRCLAEATVYLENALRKLGRVWDMQWSPAGVGCVIVEAPTDNGSTDVWEFEELTHGSALKEEGVAMRHCVAGYDRRCADGVSLIVSLRCNNVRVLTLELDGKTLALKQVKGRFNRAPKECEMRVVQRWEETIVKKVRKGQRKRRFQTTS